MCQALVSTFLKSGDLAKTQVLIPGVEVGLGCCVFSWSDAVVPRPHSEAQLDRYSYYRLTTP